MKKREGDPWVSPPVYGRSLRGLGVNMLVRDTARTVAFARDVLGLTIVYVDADLAVLRHGEHEWMAHADHTYDAHAAAAAHARRGAARRRHRVARPRRRPRCRLRGRPGARLRGARAAERQAARPARGLHPRRRRLRLGAGHARRSASGPSSPARATISLPIDGHRSAARRVPGRRGLVHGGGRQPPLPVCAPVVVPDLRPRRRGARRRRRRPRRAADRELARGPRARHARDPRGGRRLDRGRGRSAHPALPRRIRPVPRPRRARRALAPDGARAVPQALNGRYERVAASTTSEAARTVAALGDVTVAAIASPLAARTLRPRRSWPTRSPITPRTSRASSRWRASRGSIYDAHTEWHTALRLITKHEPGALHDRHRAAALPRRADDLAALAADHGRALALPVLRRRG